MLKVRNLTVVVNDFSQKKILNNVSLDIQEGEILSIVGGSGSGKSTTALAMLCLLSESLCVTSGRIMYENLDLMKASSSQIRAIRGGQISMVFQEPLYAFNPVFPIGYQIEESLRIHTTLTLAQRKIRILELLSLTGISDPKRVAHSYPHQLSGGMRQRSMIAMAIAGQPKLLLADEPTSNLDVTLQAKIMELFRQLRKDLGLSIVLITHDLGMAQHMADRIVVMSEGFVHETAKTEQLFASPESDVTKQLLEAIC